MSKNFIRSGLLAVSILVPVALGVSFPLIAQARPYGPGNGPGKSAVKTSQRSPAPKGGARVDAVTAQGASASNSLASAAGTAQLTPDPLFCGSPLKLVVSDLDLQGSGDTSVELTSESGDLEVVLLSETSPGSDVFEATVGTVEAAAIPNDGLLEVAHDDELVLSYFDEDDGTGNSAFVTASVDANCSSILGFELGDFSGWETKDLTIPFFAMIVEGSVSSPHPDFFTSAPTEGVFAALNGFDGNGPGTIELGTDLTLAPFASTIEFDYRAAWDLLNFGATADRSFTVEIEPAGGGAALQSTTILVATVGTLQLDTGDLVGSVDVSAFAGQSIRLSFEWWVPEDFSGPGFFQLDAVRVVEVLPDSDGDGVDDPDDNCMLVPNPDQCDTNLDGLGNVCDADVTNDGVVAILDFNVLRSNFGKTCDPIRPWGDCADTDFTCDGSVAILDFNILRSTLGGPPGPSGLSCEGTAPCPPSACPHHPCTTGALLLPTCGSCEATICALDPYCCESSWDSLCAVRAQAACVPSCGPPPLGLLYGSVPKSRLLVIVDPNTGLTTVAQNIDAPANVSEIEWSPDGTTLYGTTGGGDSSLLTIDPDTGQVTASVSHLPGALNGLEFDQNGDLLGTHMEGPGTPSSLVKVDPATGATTVVGPTGFAAIGGIAFTKDFGTLYGATSGDTGPPVLVTLDPTTGIATPIAPVGVGAEVSSLEIDEHGRLLAAAGDGTLYEINPATGAATEIGPLGQDKLSGLSFRPNWASGVGSAADGADSSP